MVDGTAKMCHAYGAGNVATVELKTAAQFVNMVRGPNDDEEDCKYDAELAGLVDNISNYDAVVIPNMTAGYLGNVQEIRNGEYEIESVHGIVKYGNVFANFILH